MNHHTLREVAKVGSGLVIADMIGVIWFATKGLFPLTMLGVTWTSAMIPEILLFDTALLIFLVHFGWSMKLPITSPSERALLMISGIIFLVVALGHFLRLTLGWQLILGDFNVPDWLSWVGVFVTGYLSYSSFHFARHGHH